jgi:hypothetical protein
MSQNNTQFGITNEQLLLINILNTMYNDNLRQINNLTSSNNEIRNLIVRLLNNNNNNNHNQRGRNTNRQQRNYNYRESYTHQPLNNDTLRNTPLLFEYILDLQPYTATQNATQNDTFTRIFERFLEPIEVYPTPSQIETATRIARYGDIIAPRNRSCPISLENFNDDDTVSVIRFCGHIFDRDELNTWFGRNHRCPVCRYDIRNYNPNNSTENSTNNSSASQPAASPVLSHSNSSENNIERNTPNFNYSNVLSSTREELLDFILDPSSDSSANVIQTILDSYQRRRQ